MRSVLAFITAALAAAAGCLADVDSGSDDLTSVPAPPPPVPFGKCYEPKKVGPCKAAIPRWYYNTFTGKCEKFSWGGCEPNGNNFKRKLDCKKACKSRRVCKRAYKVGPCKARILRWFYNKYTKKCESFFWGGCRSNGNNFKTVHDCEKKCAERKDRCKLPKDPGNCKGYFKKWYYDHKAKKCKWFIWGGCGGNGNRFDSRSACKRHCGRHHG